MKNKIFSLIAIVLSAVCLTISAVVYGNSGLKANDKGVDLNYAQIESGSGRVLEYYVDNKGSDQNEGTQEKPLKSLLGAFEKIKANKYKIEKNNENPENKVISDINIYLNGGDYFVDDSSVIRIDGTFLPLGVNFNVKAIEGQTPTINGGRKVENWEATTLNGKSVLKAQLNKGLEGMYSLYVNGVSAELANSMTDKNFDSCNLSKQNQKNQSYIDNQGSFTWEFLDASDEKAGFKVTSNLDKLSALVNPSETHAVWLIEWKQFITKLDSVEGNVVKSEYWKKIASEHMFAENSDWFWPAPIHNFYLQNDVSLIDRPGEFCYNSETGELFYYPLEGQTATNISAYIPVATKLMDLSTTARKGYITNMTFDGITFANSAVDYIDFYGGMGITQAQTFITGEAVGTTASWTPTRDNMDFAITMNYCKNVAFKNCEFRNLGLSAIGMEYGCQGCVVSGCVFKDLGNCAVVISNPNNHNATVATRAIDNVVENNVIRRVGQINNSAPAILNYYSENTNILHNDIAYCPYTAISVGWGWASIANSYANSNNIAFNKAGNYLMKLKDGGGIYTLGQQPYSTIEYNYFYSQRNNYAAIYLDEGTSGYTVTNNACFLDGLIDENGEYFLDEFGEPYDEYYKQPVSLTWLNLNDATGFAGTEESPMKNIKVVTNYYCAKKGFGKTDSHPGNIIPPVLNDDSSHPEWENKSFANYDAFFGDSSVQAIISMAGVEEDYEDLLSRV